MKLHYGKTDSQYAFGIYLYNWGYPIRNDWELGLNLFRWYVGIDFFK